MHCFCETLRNACRTALALALCAFAVPAGAEEICTFPASKDIAIEKELLITDLSVVDDPRASNTQGGAWSFAGLMSVLARENAAGTVKDWLASFDRRQQVSGSLVPARPAVRARVIEPWMRKDRATTFDAWRPDLANAPFRLLAIVYRPDLGIVSKDGAIRSAGEVRFVFTALDLTTARDADAAPPLPFTLIFEYGLPASDRAGVKAWATRWHALGSLDFDAAFNVALQAITDQVIGRDRRPPQATLNQLRTNEGLALPWQLREFRFDLDTNRFANAPLKDTPRQSFIAEGRELSAIISRQPDDDLPARFLGAAADIPDKRFRWPQMQIANNVLRHNFALRTCNGCHSAETGIKADDHAGEPARHRGFRHISGRARGERARLSEFMTGDPALVMDETGKVHTFCDLKIRQQALHEALGRAGATEASPPADDLAVARKRRERSD